MKTFRSAEILIPQKVDMMKWSVVACDQYTSEPEYWRKTEELVGEAPSALHVVFPEIYLEEGEERIEKSIEKWRNICKKGFLKLTRCSMIYVERVLGEGKVRLGNRRFCRPGGL